MRRRVDLRDQLADDRDSEAVADLIARIRAEGIDSDEGLPSVST